jgi:lipopolysaccharide heptosyltransferase II
MSAVPWEDARELLCVRLDAAGDVLMTTPALRALKEAAPGRRITLLASSAGAEAAALVPEGDRVIAYEAPWMKATEPRSDPAPDLGLAERLRAERFDAAVIFTVYSQSPLPAALLCHLAGIPRRLAHCRENPYALLTDWVREPEPEQGVRHEVQRQLDLVAEIGARPDHTGLSLEVTSATRRSALEALRACGHDPDEPWLAIHPGASAPSRRYPWMSEAAALVHAETGRRLVVTAGPGEREAAEAVCAAAGAGAVSLADRLSFAELAALIEAAPLLICNNSGPAHVAAAVGTPTVVLYALTNPQHSPWETPSRVLSHDVPCRWCYRSVCPEGHHDCLRKVTPGEVVAAALELLAEGDDVPADQAEAAVGARPAG